MATINTFEELLEQIEENGDLLTLEMATLRDVYGAGKLGVHVVAGISEKLDELGLGHYPAELPQQQWERVRVYSRRKPVGKLIRAALTLDDRSDKALREIAGDDAAETLKKVKELVCD